MTNVTPSLQRIAPAGKKTQNRHLSNLCRRIPALAVRAMLPVKINPTYGLAEISIPDFHQKQ